MRVGIVCPYSLDVPGGVQNHIRDFAETLIHRGHEVSVLAPSDDDTPLPPYAVSAGRAIPVPYNGSVARLTLGPVSAARVRRWIRDGAFDVLHVHEPASPSLGLLAIWAAEGPIVATFHSSIARSRALSAFSAILKPTLEKVTARIAVSELARDTLVQHLGSEPVIIPNGLYVDRLAGAEPVEQWRGEAGTVSFLGRLEEPRKGLGVLLDAVPQILAERPGVRFLVAGSGDTKAAKAEVPSEFRDAVTFLGRIDDREKARMLATSDVYVAPNTGGESFGIVLVEAMAAGAPVLASDLRAFARVLDGGRVGALFDVGDSAALAAEALALLGDPDRRQRMRDAAALVVRRYDWATVADEILAVYDMVTRTGVPVRPAPVLS